MAVDTRAKRQSAHRAANRWAGIQPDPDGTVAQADRQHHLSFYGGILAAAVAVPVLFPPQIGDAADRTWRATALRAWRVDAPERTWKTDSE